MTAVKKSIVSLSSKAMLILLVFAVVALEQTQVVLSQSQGPAQTCATDLTNLNLCAPFVLPGATNTNPSVDCCGALQSVNHDCLCQTLRIAARLPAQCNLPPLVCGN